MGTFRHVSALCVALGFATSSLGCARSGRPPELPAQEPIAALPPLEGTGLAADGAPEDGSFRRQIGDYVAQRFSGTFRERPFTLVEEVVAREGDLLVVDYTLSRGGDDRVLRVRFDESTGRIVQVSHLRDGQETPGQLADYEDLMAMTSFAPERNEGRLRQDAQTCLVGPRELDCELEEYSVLVDGHKAVLLVEHSPELERDVAGEIRAIDGTVLYRTELIDLREGGKRSPEEVGLSAIAPK